MATKTQVPIPKYPIRGQGTELTYRELQKIKDGIEKQHESNMFWKILPFALLVAFSLVAIAVMMSRAAGGNF